MTSEPAVPLPSWRRSLVLATGAAALVLATVIVWAALPGSHDNGKEKETPIARDGDDVTTARLWRMLDRVAFDQKTEMLRRRAAWTEKWLKEINANTKGIEAHTRYVQHIGRQTKAGLDLLWVDDPNKIALVEILLKLDQGEGLNGAPAPLTKAELDLARKTL